MFEVAPSAPTHPLSEPILRALLYADIFAYPLTVDEIHRRLVGVNADREQVLKALEGDPWLRARVTWRPPWVALAGRAQCFRRRQGREAANAWLWQKAHRYGALLAAIPFVRMVAVTGALAAQNAPSADDDIDYLLVTLPNRLWLARFCAVLLVRVAALERVSICPNYFLSCDALGQFERSSYVAHELAQMVPLYGHDVYKHVLHTNAWAIRMLPNAFTHREGTGISLARIASWGKKVVEAGLSGHLGDAWERWERGRKIARLSARAARAGATEAVFSAKCCKGHIEDHGLSVARAYAERLRLAGLGPDWD